MKRVKRNGWMAMRFAGVLGLWAWATSLAAPVPIVELRVAAASDLKYAMDEWVHEYEKTHPGISVKVTYGASGSLATQILQRAPFDVFFSADASLTDVLIQKGMADRDSEIHYAKGSLVLWSTQPKLDLDKEGMKALLNPEVRKIAIANPAHAPYGKAAVAALEAAGIYDQVKDKLVLGENVAQAAQFVQSQAAQIGIIALSLAKAPPLQKEGTFWLIPSQWFPKLDQVGVAVNRGDHFGVSKEFLKSMRSPESKKILSRYGLLGF